MQTDVMTHIVARLYVEDGGNAAARVLLISPLPCPTRLVRESYNILL
jgi:hypothetical protein